MFRWKANKLLPVAEFPQKYNSLLDINLNGLKLDLATLVARSSTNRNGQQPTWIQLHKMKIVKEDKESIVWQFEF